MLHPETAGPAAGASGQERERPTVLFFSDCHLAAIDSATERARRGRVNRFLQSIDPVRSALYIVGDLFDFWFTYRHSIPRHGFDILATLAALRRAGLPITFLAGNHDYWALPFLREELGVETWDGSLSRTIHGRRFLIAHGDGLGSGDLGYKLLKQVFRNRLAIALYRLIHPDLGIRLATASARLSRTHGEGDDRAHVERLYREAALPAFAGGHQVAVFGHVHLPTLRQTDGGTMVVLGDWITHFSFLRLEAGRLELLSFEESGEVRRLAGEGEAAARAGV